MKHAMIIEFTIGKIRVPYSAFVSLFRWPIKLRVGLRATS